MVLLLALVTLMSGFAPSDAVLHCQASGERGRDCCCTGLAIEEWKAADRPCGCCEVVLDEASDDIWRDRTPRAEGPQVESIGVAAAVHPVSIILPRNGRDRPSPIATQSVDPPPRRPLYIQYAARLI